MSLFEVQDLIFRYGEETALDIPGLAIEEGGMVCLTGANGSGKSTLLGILGGLLSPDRGRVLYRGTDLARAPVQVRESIRREMGICLQSPYLFRTTVERNVSYGLGIRGIKGAERDQRVAEALRDVRMGGFAGRRWNTLSGGEVQRVAIARALALEPRVLLLDEPMANVDAATRILLERILHGLIASRGITIVLSTHDFDQAMRLGIRIINLHGGRIAEGGIENVFHGVLTRRGEDRLFETGHCSFFVSPSREDAGTAIIPPEAVTISRQALMSSARNVLKAEVVGIRKRNGSVEVTLDAGEEIVARITEGSLEKLGLRLGSEVYLAIKAEAIMLY